MKLPLVPIAPPRDIPVHSNCARCMALCCHSVSTEIDVPTTEADFDNLRWFLMHPGVRVYVDAEGAWFLMFESRCRHLGPDNLCQIYDRRPKMCRDLSPDTCEFAVGPEDRHYFTSLEEFDAWREEQRRRQRARRKRAAARRSRNGHGGVTRSGARRGR